MNTIKATVRGDRLEVAEPINLPDGTELLIPLPNGPGQTEEDAWDNSPQGIADWLKWFESLPTLTATPEEEADTEAWLKKMDAYGVRKKWGLAPSLRGACPHFFRTLLRPRQDGASE